MKFQNPAQIINNAGIYLTCNNLPDFGDEQVNVYKRLAVFETTTMPELKTQAPQWIEDNAMDCLCWILNELNNNADMIPLDERYYYKSHDQFIKEEVDEKQNVSEELKKLTKVNIAHTQIDPAPASIDQAVERAGTSGTKRTKSKTLKSRVPSWLENLQREGKYIQ